jgi:preprotein translocase subunit SecA
LIRKDEGDVIYRNFSAKVNAVVRDVKERQKKGQPVLLGTTSITKNEIFSAALANAGVKYEVLNAKNNEREGATIAQAGRLGAVTVATNMAGRGVDIILGGNPPDIEESKKVKELGGLHIIGTERHEARRIDNQLKGRAGRQGDSGSSQFFLSLEDDLLRIFGGDRIKNLMERFDLPEEEPINFSFVSKAVAQAQQRVEGANFDMRKHLLEYDDVLNRQRTAVYKKRNEILKILNKEDLGNFISGATLNYFDHAYGQISSEQVEEVKRLFEESGLSRVSDLSEVDFSDPELCKKVIEEKAKEAGNNPSAKNQLISVLDMLWMNNLEDLEALSESVGLRAYGQKDPLVEYRHEASKFYSNFWNNFNAIVFMNVFKLIGNSETIAEMPKQKILDSKYQNVGRNDLCPCGSGKKFKHCHGANL